MDAGRSSEAEASGARSESRVVLAWVALLAILLLVSVAGYLLVSGIQFGDGETVIQPGERRDEPLPPSPDASFP